MASKRTLAIIGSCLAILVLVGVAGAVGYRVGTHNPATLTIRGITNIGDDDVKADFSVFWQAWKAVEEEFYFGEKKMDAKASVYGATKGLVDSLGDPHTNFFPPAEAKKFNEDIKGEFGGIGAEIGIKQEQLIIIAPLEGSPAERAGLKAGDKILKINDEETVGIEVGEAVTKIRGPIGTVVRLSMFRDEWKLPRDFSIKRETIKVPIIKTKMLSGGVAHISLYSFSADSAPAFYREALSALTNGAKGIILDLRNNPGGYLESSVDIAGMFLEKGQLVVSEKTRSGAERLHRAMGSEILKDTPVVVIVNAGSASASEILAGALRDNRSVKLVGEKTYGKGSVQELKDLIGGASLKLTIAHWFTPGGYAIEKNGLKPDYEIKITESDLEASKDPQLDKALEILKQELRSSN